MANINIIAGDSSEIDGQFEAFYNFLKQSYPLVFNQRSLVQIAFDPVEGNSSNKPHSILLKWQGTNPSLLPVLLASHMGKPKVIHVLLHVISMTSVFSSDVVPVEEESRSLWKFDPWNGTIADGFIWGRGTLDDKVRENSCFFCFLLLLLQQLLRVWNNNNNR